MKKSFLLLITAVCFSFVANAQQRNLMNISGDRDLVSKKNKPVSSAKNLYSKSQAAHKTTLGGSRWYSYVDAIDTAYKILHGMPGIGYGVCTIWNDTLGEVMATTGLKHNIFVSEADIFDPKAAFFNDYGLYIGFPLITAATPYTVDSITIAGWYQYNVTKSSIVDTLRIVWTKGSDWGGFANNIFDSNYLAGGGHYGPDSFLDVSYDSIANQMTGIISGDLHTATILLDNTGPTPAWGDTDANGTWSRTIPVSVSCAAGQLLATSITFISGDPATHTGGILHAPASGDTIVTSPYTANNKYNIWRPEIAFYVDYTMGPLATDWPPNLVPSDNNAGYWKTVPNYALGWKNVYIPMWAFNSASPSELQFPYISYHATCPTCSLILPTNTSNLSLVNSCNVYPNPVSEELSISFELSQLADVTISLTNIIGQVVETRNLSNVTDGKTIFNTRSLPEGIYIYSVTASGERSAGRVLIAH